MRGDVEGARRETWPAALAPLVRDVVQGSRRRCPVLGAFPGCVYLGLGAHERVLALVSSDAVRLPIALRLADRMPIDWGVAAGDLVEVGEGRVRLPVADVVVARVLPVARVRPVSSAPARPLATPPTTAMVAGDASDTFSVRARALTRAALCDNEVHHDVDGHVLSLVGRGQGLTPSGDDVLCGILLVLHAFDGPPVRRALAAMRRAVAKALSRTTSISAALLVAATHGEAAPEVVDLVKLLAAGHGESDHDTALVVATRSRVLAIGHTSGADLVTGIEAALAALAPADLALAGGCRA